jgi:1,4-dihydroxy-2-naphthoate octaprenyltransferase
MIVLAFAQGWPIIAFALGGFLLSAAYTAPPLRLKKHGLGEPTVLVVWGPLMVGGTYYAATGHIPGAVILASLPYALLCTTVLMGKHIDKIPWDEPDGTRTLPVIIGERAARRVTQGMFITFYVAILALVIARVLPVASVLVVLSFPVLRRTFEAYNHPKPDVSPMPNPVWPLWFAALSFLVTRRAGGLFVLGLIIGAIVGW